MRPPTVLELLTVWENSIDQTLLQKTLNLLSLACPEIDSDSVARLSIGERDARLLLLREWLFGPQLINMADCPECSMRIEWNTDIKDIRLQPIQQQQNTKREFSLDVDEFSIRFRLPNSFDILTVFANGAEQPATPSKLLTLCLLETQCNGEVCEVNELPDRVLEALSHRMEEEDPQADIRMNLSCPHCSHQWEVQFDIESYLWTEINRWTERILQDVHILANAYGWSEHDILNLSPVRRQTYLNMVNS